MWLLSDHRRFPILQLVLLSFLVWVIRLDLVLARPQL
jgi:hypothetical protein